LGAMGEDGLDARRQLGPWPRASGCLPQAASRSGVALSSAASCFFQLGGLRLRLGPPAAPASGVARLERRLIDVVEEGEQLVILAPGASGSNLWSWHWQQPTVRPRKTGRRWCLTRSTTDSTRKLFPRRLPPSWLSGVFAVEAGGDALLPGGVGQEVAGELLDGELVEGHCPCLRGVDDPSRGTFQMARGPSML